MLVSERTQFQKLVRPFLMGFIRDSPNAKNYIDILITIDTTYKNYSSNESFLQ